MKHVAIIAALLPTCVTAQSNVSPITHTAPEIHFIDSGIICAMLDVGLQDAPDTIAGSTHIVETTPSFVSNGRLVPAMIGVGFGTIAAVQGGQALEGVAIHVTHPPLGDNGATQQSFSAHLGPESDPGISYYQFDFDYELAIGEWTIEARFDDYVLYSTSFLVVPPETLPELSSVCGYTDLFS